MMMKCAQEKKLDNFYMKLNQTHKKQASLRF